MEPPPPRRRRASPPAIPDELFEEFLLRLPPDDPACLLRASLVCKAWAGTVSSPGFRRRLHELHRKPPMLGFLHNWPDERIPRFIHTTASPFSLAAPVWRTWRALDYRHRRALFFPQEFGGPEMLLWDPITGAQQRIPVPPAFMSDDFPTAAVFCAADGCDHRDCFGGPFRVVFFFTVEVGEGSHATSACIYSSETGAWGELTSVHSNHEFLEFRLSYSVLVDRSALYFMFDGNADTASVVQFDLASHDLTVFGLPDTYYDVAYSLVLVEDGGIGVIQCLNTRLILWRREPSAEAGWVLNRVMCLEHFLPMDALLHVQDRVQVVGFAEEANVIFVDTVAGLFIIELQSGHVRKVCSDHGFGNLIPVVSFYTPVTRGKHQNLPASKPSDKPGGGDGGEEEKRVDQAQQLLNKGSNAIKEVFINTFEYISHDLEIRVPCYGEGALEGAGTLNKPGCTLLPKDSLGDVPKSAPSLCICFHLGFPGVCECTTRRDDARNSTTSESNVEDDPPLEKEQQQEEEKRKHQYKEK